MAGHKGGSRDENYFPRTSPNDPNAYWGAKGQDFDPAYAMDGGGGGAHAISAAYDDMPEELGQVDPGWKRLNPRERPDEFREDNPGQSGTSPRNFLDPYGYRKSPRPWRQPGDYRDRIAQAMTGTMTDAGGGGGGERDVSRKPKQLYGPEGSQVSKLNGPADWGVYYDYQKRNGLNDVEMSDRFGPEKVMDGEGELVPWDDDRHPGWRKATYYDYDSGQYPVRYSGPWNKTRPRTVTGKPEFK